MQTFKMKVKLHDNMPSGIQLMKAFVQILSNVGGVNERSGLITNKLNEEIGYFEIKENMEGGLNANE